MLVAILIGSLVVTALYTGLELASARSRRHELVAIAVSASGMQLLAP